MAKGDTPQFIAHAVARHNGRDIWTRVGAVFVNDSGSQTLLLNPGVAVSGKVVMLANDREDADPYRESDDGGE